MGLRKRKSFPLVSTLPADASLYAGQVVVSPRWPLVGSLPGTVVDGQRWRIAEVGQTYGREYLGVSGAWVPQDSVTMGVWQSRWNGFVGYTDISPANFDSVSFDIPEDLLASDFSISTWIQNVDTESQYKSPLYIQKSGVYLLYVSTTPIENSWTINFLKPNGDWFNGLYIRSEWDVGANLKIERVSNTINAYLDSVLVGSFDCSDWGVVTNDDLCIRSSDGLKSILFSNVLIKKNGIVVNSARASNNLGLTVENTVGESLFTHKIRVGAIGDSITFGTGGTGDQGWFVYTGSKSLQLQNNGIPSGTTQNFLDALYAIVPTVEVDVICYSPYTPNGMSPAFNLDEETMELQKSNFKKAFDYLSARNIPIIVMELTPLNAYSIEQDNRRKQIINYAYSLTGRKISLIDEVSTMDSPNRWSTDIIVTDDGLHPNDAGYAPMRVKFNAELEAIIESLSSRNHRLGWVPL